MRVSLTAKEERGGWGGWGLGGLGGGGGGGMKGGRDRGEEWGQVHRGRQTDRQTDR